MEYTILGNTVKLFFTPKMDGERSINSDFDYSSQVFVNTHGITDILKYKGDEELRVAQQIIFNDIIIKIKEASQTQDLDFFQLLEINWHKCILIDSWNHICIMGSEEG